MMKLDLTGQTFGRLTAMVQMSAPGEKTRWRCLCSCGQTAIVATSKLRNGHTQSCGCYRHDQIVAAKFRHGQAKKGTRSQEYAIWAGMKTRCYNARTQSYPRYGGRGIKVADEWLNNFSAFFADVGPRPSKLHSVERIDNDGDYAPGNVRWATRKEQANNRNERRLVRNGNAKLTAGQAKAIVDDSRSSSAIARELGVSVTTICRIRKGNSWVRHLVA